MFNYHKLPRIQPMPRDRLSTYYSEDDVIHISDNGIDSVCTTYEGIAMSMCYHNRSRLKCEEVGLFKLSNGFYTNDYALKQIYSKIVALTWMRAQGLTTPRRIEYIHAAIDCWVHKYLEKSVIKVSVPIDWTDVYTMIHTPLLSTNTEIMQKVNKSFSLIKQAVVNKHRKLKG